VLTMQTFPVRRPTQQSSSARETRWWKLAVVLLGLVSIGWGIGCGLGSYDDLGEPVPGQRWPWVCPEGGDPTFDGGCPPAASTDAATVDNAADAATERAS
jgi:hypothetical protein